MLPLFLLEIIDTEDDRNKMELLYIKYQRLMFKVAKDILEDDYLAEDAVNDAFVKVVGYLDRIKEVECPQTKNLLVIIVKNVSLNIVNSKSYRNEVYYGSADDWKGVIDGCWHSIDDEDDYIEKCELDKAVDAMMKLPILLKHTLYLKSVEGMSLEEISELEECSVEAVRKRLYRARKLLKSLLVEGGE